MKQYVVILTGGNCLIGEESKRKFPPKLKVVHRFGFATTRVVTATTREEACKLAIEAAYRELKDSNEIRIINDASNPPSFEIDEITEYEIGEKIDAPNKGFTFFPEEPTSTEVDPGPGTRDRRN